MKVIKDLSGVMIVQDEEPIVNTAIDNIYKYVDEIIIVDGGSKDGTIDKIKSYPDNDRKIRLFKYPFADMIGDQKNLALSKTSGLWSLWIDADETFEKKVLSNLRGLIQTNEYHVYAFPRKNFIDGKNTGVYPDYQLRLFRSFCRYIKAPHEELVGWHGQLIHYLQGEKCHILHPKTSVRQERQDDLYGRIDGKTNFSGANLTMKPEDDYWYGKEREGIVEL